MSAQQEATHDHVFTFRWELQGSGGVHGWTEITVGGTDAVPTSHQLWLGKERVRQIKVDQLGCHPGEVVPFLVNHTALVRS